MKAVTRDEIVDYQTYEDDRPRWRAEAMAAKDARRIHLGSDLTFLFENRVTVRYQVQEMMRAEKLVREADILRELETYNELLGGEGELGCTLLIEIQDQDERKRKLSSWLGLPEATYLLLEDGRRVRPEVDRRQVDVDRISAVQFLKFSTGGEVPVGLGCDLPGVELEAPFTPAQRSALAADLA